ncbi:hypothetical protein PENTCL1PPCAC_1898, partial [Pristionchus entomophagus]
MYYHLLFPSLLLTGCLSIERRRFMPRSNAYISDKSNYLQEELPCRNDVLSFSANGEQPVLAVINQPLDVSEVQFPDVGVIYLDGNTVIGGVEGTEWQCQKRQNVSYAYFDEYPSDQDVYDPKTWSEMNARNAPKFELHMNRVPGAADSVEIFERNPIHLKIFDDFAVKEWKDYKREMTTDDFVQRLRTLEGQLTIQLGAKLVKEYDIDGIALMRPIGEPIRVGEDKGSYREGVYGSRNPNLENKTMTAICGHIHCDLDSERVPPRCINTFTPKGHCCPICGTLYEIQTYLKRLDDLEMLFSHFSDEFARRNKKKLIDFFHTSTERVDESDYEMRYQIVLIVKDNSTVLDQDLLTSTSTLFLSILGEYWHPTEGFQLVEFKESARDHSYETSSIILGIIFFCLFSIISTFYFSADARNQTRFLYRRGRLIVEGLRAGSAPAEVEMSEHLVPRGEEMGDLASECESANPVFFANRAFSMASLDKEGTLIDVHSVKSKSERENEPSKDIDSE